MRTEMLLIILHAWITGSTSEITFTSTRMVHTEMGQPLDECRSRCANAPVWTITESQQSRQSVQSNVLISVIAADMLRTAQTLIFRNYTSF